MCGQTAVRHCVAADALVFIVALPFPGVIAEAGESTTRRAGAFEARARSVARARVETNSLNTLSACAALWARGATRRCPQPTK